MNERYDVLIMIAFSFNQRELTCCPIESAEVILLRAFKPIQISSPTLKLPCLGWFLP